MTKEDSKQPEIAKAKPDQTERLIHTIEELDNSIEQSMASSGYIQTFIKGVFGAVGAAVGATIVLGIIVIILHKLAGAPYIGTAIQFLLNQLQQTKK